MHIRHNKTILVHFGLLTVLFLFSSFMHASSKDSVVLELRGIHERVMLRVKNGDRVMIKCGTDQKRIVGRITLVNEQMVVVKEDTLMIDSIFQIGKRPIPLTIIGTTGVLAGGGFLFLGGYLFREFELIQSKQGNGYELLKSLLVLAGAGAATAGLTIIGVSSATLYGFPKKVKESGFHFYLVRK